MKPTGDTRLPPPPPVPWLPGSPPLPPPKPQRALATGMTVIPSRSTGSPNTAVARAATPIRSASCWTISDPSTSRETSEKVMGPTLQRDVPEREPALELGLERQLGPELRLQLELALVVALLRARRRHERVEEAALVVVDEVDRAALLLEGEDGGQHAVAVAA